MKPPLSDRELVDMFMGTLKGPFFNHLIGSSLSCFIEMILTGEHVEGGIKSGNIQVVASSSAVKNTFNGKKEKMLFISRRVVLEGTAISL